MTRATSREAYQSIKPTLNARQTAVYGLLEGFHGALTNKEIAEALGWPINTVTPRTGELVELGLVYDAGTRRDPITGRKAHTWAAGAPSPQQVMRTEYVNIGGTVHARLVPAV